MSDETLHVVKAGCLDCRTQGGLAYITIDGIAYDAQTVAALVLNRAAVAELVAAAKAIKFDVFDLTSAELRAAFGGKSRIFVLDMDTMPRFYAALTSAQGGAK